VLAEELREFISKKVILPSLTKAPTIQPKPQEYETDNPIDITPLLNEEKVKEDEMTRDERFAYLNTKTLKRLETNPGESFEN